MPPSSKFQKPAGGRRRDSDTDQPQGGPNSSFQNGEQSPTRRHSVKESDQKLRRLPEMNDLVEIALLDRPGDPLSTEKRTLI